MATSDETERLLRLLQTMQKLLGFTNRALERKMGIGPSYLSRLYNGTIALRVELLLKLVDGLGLTAPEFFSFAYPGGTETPKSQAAQRLRAALAPFLEGKL